MDILTTEGVEFIALHKFVNRFGFNPHAFQSFELCGVAHRFSPEVCEVAPELDMLYEAQSVKLRIKATANHPHWRDKAESDSYCENKKTPFELICGAADIEFIEIRYRDGQRKHIRLPWESFDIDGMSWLREENMFQKAWVDEQGCLNLSIDKSNREEMFRKQKANAPIFMTKGEADMQYVLSDYSDFDFTKIPLLYSEKQFEAYSQAFMEKYGKNACIRDEMEEEGITEQDLERDKIVDGKNIYDILEVYNSVRCMMGHEILGFKEENDWEEY